MRQDNESLTKLITSIQSKQSDPNKTPYTGRRTAAGNASTAGIRKGTAAYRAVLSENQRIRREKNTGKNPVLAKAIEGYWANMNPEQRSQEMKRRQRLGRQKRRGATLSEQRKAAWAAMPPKQQKARLAAMQAGRRQHTNGEAIQ